jgi:hypothetical protein
VSQPLVAPTTSTTGEMFAIRLAADDARVVTNRPSVRQCELSAIVVSGSEVGQILRAVVESVAVDMVSVLSGQQRRSAKDA